MKSDKFTSVMLILVISLSGTDGAMIYQHYMTPQQQIQSAVNGITVGLTVKAFHTNQSIPYATRYMPNDLFTNNFNNYLMQLLTPNFSCLLITDISGALYSYFIWNGGNCNNYIYYNTTACNTQPYCGTAIGIGTGTNTPARADYKLQTIYGGYFADTSACNTGTSDTTTISGSDSITSTVTITEAGLFQGTVAQPVTSSGEAFMLAHDTFVGISAISGDTITVQYTINWDNVGFTTMFCNWLTGLLQGSIQTTTPAINFQFSFTDTTGNTLLYCSGWGYATATIDVVSPSALTTSGTNCNSVAFAGASASTFINMAIGTGNTAFTPASTHLTTIVGSYNTVGNTQYVSANGAIYYTTTFTFTSTNTIEESGIFFFATGSHEYLMLGLTFTGQTETANQPFGVTMQLSD